MQLTAVVSVTTVSQMKRIMGTLLPEVKPSHRAEALARGLGFRTNAALRAALDSQTAFECELKGIAFSKYLVDHEFKVTVLPLYQTVVIAKTEEVAAQYPRLSALGYGYSAPRRQTDGNFPNPRERFQAHEASRNEMLSPKFAEAILLSIALLENVPKTKTIRTNSSSYKLKHIAENSIAYLPDGTILHDYVPNGALIVAAIVCGFSFRNYFDENGYDNPNLYFNMSQRVIDDLDCQWRPDGAVAQDRRRAIENRQWKRHGIL